MGVSWSGCGVWSVGCGTSMQTVTRTSTVAASLTLPALFFPNSSLPPLAPPLSLSSPWSLTCLCVRLRGCDLGAFDESSVCVCDDEESQWGQRTQRCPVSQEPARFFRPIRGAQLAKHTRSSVSTRTRVERSSGSTLVLLRLLPGRWLSCLAFVRVAVLLLVPFVVSFFLVSASPPFLGPR